MDAIIMHYIVDLATNNNYVQIVTVQGDGSNTRYIEIELIQRGIPYVLDSSEVNVTIVGTKPDGTAVWNNCEVTQQGYIKVPITYQMSAVEGKSTYQIMIFNTATNSQLKSFPFILTVTKSAFDPKYIMSSDEFEVLIKYADAAEKTVASVEESLAPVEENTTSTAAYAIGEQFIHEHTLYETTAAINIGDTIVPGTNCKASDTIAEQIQSKEDASIYRSVTLLSGSTHAAFADIPTTGNYLVSIFCSLPNVEYSSIDDSTAGTITVVYPAQESSMTVYLKLEEV